MQFLCIWVTAGINTFNLVVGLSGWAWILQVETTLNFNKVKYLQLNTCGAVAGSGVTHNAKHMEPARKSNNDAVCCENMLV